ncbi:MAG: hypothetical protein JW388_0246 [Nitrospira sp.]|nr:hypothetical protein [Nitrospira sp.]
MNVRCMSLLVLVSLTACTSLIAKSPAVLPAPAGTSSTVVMQLERGNALFAAQKWAEAEAAYRQTIAAAPTVAEAHYNLATVLYRAGRTVEANTHYTEAANLAPGNKVIWDAPTFRDRSSSFHGDLSKKSIYDISRPQ